MPSRQCRNCINAPENGVFPFYCVKVGREVAWWERCGSFCSEGERNAQKLMIKVTSKSASRQK